MMVVFVGGDRSGFEAALQGFLKKNALGVYTSIDDPTIDHIQSCVFAQDLFAGPQVYVFRDVHKEVFEGTVSLVSKLSTENVLVFQVEKILKKEREVLEKNNWTIIELSQEKAKKSAPSFLLADAFLKRDKKAVFSALHVELMAKPPEEVHRGLWYQVKSMKLVASGASETDSGLHPFVYKKVKQACKLFSEEELDAMSESLVSMYHESHRGELDFPVALEQFALRWTR